MEEKLNNGQRQVYDNIMKELEHQERHNLGACNCKDVKPIRSFVSGTVLIDYMFIRVIQVIRALILRLWWRWEVIFDQNFEVSW